MGNNYKVGVNINKEHPDERSIGSKHKKLFFKHTHNIRASTTDLSKNRRLVYNLFKVVRVEGKKRRNGRYVFMTYFSIEPHNWPENMCNTNNVSA